MCVVCVATTSGNETVCMCSYQLASTHHICTCMHTFPRLCKPSLLHSHTQPFRKNSVSWKRHLLLSRQPRSRGGTNKCSRASKLQWRRPSLEVGQQYNWVCRCTVLCGECNCIAHLWQSQVEIKHYSDAYFDRV